ncbi:MAG: MBL fold metallo-hydrolase [Oscillospiraceae bacterium]|nr:MBL fold metallo-hydrolase [Oscillospiraceae bacterium]
MRIVTFASGSRGNCALVSIGGAQFLLDAGISFRRIREGLAGCGLAPEALSGVLITHEHSDHISGLATMLKHCDVPLYTTATVAEGLCAAVPAAARCLHEVRFDGDRVSGVELLPFPTPHDTPESVGWRLSTDGERFAAATDMGHVTEEIRCGLSGADAVLVEANHDVTMLRSGAYPPPLKRRVLSEHGHLSNDDCAALCVFLADSGARSIILGHLSRENNTPELAYHTVSAALCGRPTRLYVAPAAARLELELEPGPERCAPCLR